MLDNAILITIEGNILSTKNAKTSKIIGVGMAINDAPLDQAKRDENELTTAKKDLDHLVKYYQESTQATIFLKSEF
jgi:hypothetical protein